MKSKIFAILALVFCLCAAAAPLRTGEPEPHRFTLVLDAGHGGKDPGCVGERVKEKDVALAVVKLIGQKVQQQMGDNVNVVYTRDTDRFLELHQRASIANNANGDLFVSVHVNSLSPRSPHRRTMQGAMVLICGLGDSIRSLKVAQRENSVIELDPDYSVTYQGFDPNSAESYIIFEMYENQHQAKSREFATMALEHLVSDAGRANLNVRQQPIQVLWSTSMPAALIELDFMCNPDQERFLGSAEGQEKCAEAIYNAFREYYNRLRN